jgi:metal-responsive CopG/Arc/MetJ family transcriptional regulator
MGVPPPNPIADCDRWYNLGYTGGVKTAVSLPDELFRQADAAAKKLRVSRSKLYATAISEYLTRQRSASVTERLNAYYLRHPAKIDPGLAKAQLESLGEKW